LLKNKLIVPAPPDTPYLAPAFPVRKPGGGFRTVVDLTGINQYLVKDAQTLPILYELQARISKVRFIGKLDLKSAFWTLELDESSRVYCGICTPFGNFLPTRVLQGCINSGLAFQHAMESILAPLLSNDDPESGVFVYEDDIVMWGDSAQKYVDKVKQVLQILHDKEVQINYKKSIFVAAQLVFCGQLYTREGIKVDPVRVEALQHRTKKSYHSRLFISRNET
jgi:hypothetical protein